MKKITLLMICLLAITFANAQLNSVAIVGGGVPGGWPPAEQPEGYVDANQMIKTGTDSWSISNIILNGAVKFRGNNSWAPYDWGADGTSTFPNGTAVLGAGGSLTVPTGVYNVTFNSTTLAYTFTASTAFPIISLIGPAVGGPDVWDVDSDMATTDGVVYTSKSVHLLAGPVKWRQNHSWLPNNWGASTYPTGTAILDNQGAVDLPVEGLYNVTFNLTTLEYTFSFPSIALVGNATPAGWPKNTVGEIDPLTLSTIDGIHYTLASVVITNGLDPADNNNPRGMKFRGANAWEKEWGASTSPGFPSGIGTKTGGNITPDASGTYGVTFNAMTGAYNFGAVLATKSFNASNFKVYPNPTQNSWNFSVLNSSIESIQIIDISGKVVLSVSPKTEMATIDASSLTRGMYFAKVATANATNTIKLLKD